MRLLRSALAGVGSVGMALVLACGGGGGSTGPGPGPGPGPTVRSVAITSPSSPPSLGALGRTVEFAAEARDSTGAAVSGQTIGWTSSNTDVATITSAGVAKAVGNGTTQITASVGSVVSSPVTVTVSQVTFKVVPSPANLTFAATGLTAQLAPAARDSSDSTIVGKTFTYSSANTGVVTVNTSGAVTSVANGSTQVTASVDGLSATVPVTVAVAATVGFASQVQPIFTTNCALAACHTTPGPTGNPSMDLSAGKAYSNILNVKSADCKPAVRVIAFDPDDSYLIRKLENRSICGVQMPDGATPLTASQITTIRTWIAQGAPNN